MRGSVMFVVLVAACLASCIAMPSREKRILSKIRDELRKRDGLHSSRTKMAHEFLISKWKIWYKSLDVNKDGILSSKDTSQMKEYFEKLHPHGSKEAKELGETIEKWWKDFVFQGRKGNVNVKTFLELLQKEYVTNKEMFRGQVAVLFGMIWDALDTDADGNCSKEEFIAAFKTFGHTNVDHLKKLFTEHNPVDGQVPMDRVKKEWVDFVVNDDKTKPSLVLHSFQLGVDSS